MKTSINNGVIIPRILLPKPGTDLNKWSIIACDQFTSEPEYWDGVKKIVGDSPSTLNLLLPEIYLGSDQEEGRIQLAQKMMKNYLAQDIFTTFEGFILVERTVPIHDPLNKISQWKKRYGLMLALDLEQYDFHKGSQTLIRATEGTILERIPPRMKIRQGALLELPHILVLIDDPEKTVIEPLIRQENSLEIIYDFDLMLGSGHLKGYKIDKSVLQQQVLDALSALAQPESFRSRYKVEKDKGVLLFAMGDGNHSLATAKAFWEKIKPEVGMDHPARYALVEIENLHDPALEFEPIHRILFSVKGNVENAMRQTWGDDISITPCTSMKEMVNIVMHNAESDNVEQIIGLVTEYRYQTVSIPKPSSTLAVGTLQNFLDKWQKQGGFGRIDYVHGVEIVDQLGTQTGNLGFFLPAMSKSDLFKTVILDGVLPRKTFSMGEAKEKRFYLECRRIV